MDTIVVEAPTIKEAVAIATEKIEAGEHVVVTATETEVDEKSWRLETARSLKQLADTIATHHNETMEVRAMLTRMEDRLKLVVSSKEPQVPESTEVSQTSETLPLNPPPDEQTAGPPKGADGHPVVEEKPQSPVRKRRKI